MGGDTLIKKYKTKQYTCMVVLAADLGLSGLWQVT